MLDELNYKRLEVLATLANNPDGLEIEEFVDNGLRLSAEYLVEKGYLDKVTIYPKLLVAKSIGQNDPRLGYKINKKGDALVKEILDHTNDSLLVKGLKYL